MELEQARYNMVEQQIRPWDVLDEDVLNLFLSVPREDFVPEAYRSFAFSDMQIPLGQGERMLEPKMEARLLQAIPLAGSERVLEIGTGSGYLTALLASRARYVFSVDISPEFTRTAGEKLAAHGIANVTLETGDAAQGWARHAPYDVIVITGSLPVLPPQFAQSLNVGGRMIAVVGDAPAMQTVRVVRLADGACRTQPLFETVIPPLKHAVQPERFDF